MEFLILLGLWLLYVSQFQTNEIVAGLAAALIAAVADAVLKAEEFANFKPRLKWLLLISFDFAYVVRGSWKVTWALVRRLLGRKSRARFRAIDFHVGGNDGRSWARRTLATVYCTIPPDSIVVGIDRQHGIMLVHEIEPAAIPQVAKLLGAK